MAKRGAKNKEALRPYLTTDEVMEIAGCSRRSLMEIVDAGVVNPVQTNISAGAYAWTPSQAQLVAQARDAVQAGVTLEKIASMIEDDDPFFEAKVLAARSKTTRSVLCAELAQRRLSRFTAEMSSAHVGQQRVCYLPQRWLAIAPLRENCPPGSHAQVNLLKGMRSLCVQVGWAATEITGTLSYALRGEAKGFAFIELAEQPLPAPLPKGMGRSGCYKSFGGDCRGGGSKDCSLCPHGPASYDSSWLAYLEDDMPTTTAPILGSDDVEYACGPWSDWCTLWAAGGQDKLGLLSGEPYAGMRRTAAIRPALMPMPEGVALPLGLMACVLPAGTYLCRRCEVTKASIEYNSFCGMLRALPKRDLITSAEEELSRNMESHATRQFNGRAPYEIDPLEDPSAPVTFEGDPTLTGFSMVIEDDDLHKVTVHGACGLERGADPVVVSVSTPGEKRGMPGTCDLQVYVDAADMLPKRKRSRASHGFARLLGSLLGNGKGTCNVRCRHCGVTMHVDETASAAVCPSCGTARCLPRFHNFTSFDAQQCAESAMEREDEKEALLHLEFAMEHGIEDPELAWSALLIRYGVTYLTGGKPMVLHTELGPVTDHELYKLAMKHADKEQREIYRLEAAKMA